MYWNFVFSVIYEKSSWGKHTRHNTTKYNHGNIILIHISLFFLSTRCLSVDFMCCGRISPSQLTSERFVQRRFSWKVINSYQVLTVVIPITYVTLKFAARVSWRQFCFSISGHEQSSTSSRAFEIASFYANQKTLVFSNPYHSFATLVILNASGRRTDKGLVDYQYFLLLPMLSVTTFQRLLWVQNVE